jgi:hypothetical protein
VSCWGLGQTLIPKSKQPSALNTLLATAVGMGVAICSLQALAVLGVLKAPGILALIALGSLAALIHWARKTPHPVKDWLMWWSSLSLHARGSVLLLGLFFSSTLLLPMAPPLGGDEAMYHLPHARAWAESGALDIHGWLRYPWFPFNLDLPFAAALLLYDDVFAHLLSALPGWICAGLVFHIALRFAPIPAASIATILWLQAGRDQYALAGVDLGAALFVFAAYAAYLQAQDTEKKSGWLAVAAFLLGVACGGKYQALSFIPLLVLGVWLTDRTPSTLLKAAAALLLPCGYWYARNALMTGDPFQPMGGKIFGFTDWNLADYQTQFADLKRHAGWPQWYLWAVVLVPLFRPLREMRHIPTALAICAYSFAFWLATSHYPRYLLPTYPLLCILSVIAWRQVLHPMRAQVVHRDTQHAPKTSRYIWGALLIPLASVVAMEWHTELKQVSPTPASREALFSATIASYDALSYVNQNPTQKIYQIALDDAIYFSAKPLYGDDFGPWRFADFVTLPPKEFAAKLIDHGVNTLVIRTTANRATEQQTGFGDYFSPVFSRNGVTVYHVQSKPQ